MTGQSSAVDPQQVYDEVLEEEVAAGSSEEAAKAKAEAAAERARLGSPHPKEAKFWVSEQGPEPRRDPSVETPTTSRPVTEAETIAKTDPTAASERPDQALAPGTSPVPGDPAPEGPATEPSSVEADPPPTATPTEDQPATAEEAAWRPSQQLHQAESHPDDDLALQSQWDSQARVAERQRLMAERRGEINDLTDTGVPLVTASNAGRSGSPAAMVLYVLVPLAAILIFALGLSNGGSSEASSGASSGGTHNTLTDVTVSAANVKFDTSTITLAANKQVTVHFDNKDSPSVQHNVAFYESESATKKIYEGKTIPGGSSADYSFKTPKPGTYFFRCDVHPTSMTGKLVVK